MTSWDREDKQKLEGGVPLPSSSSGLDSSDQWKQGTEFPVLRICSAKSSPNSAKLPEGSKRINKFAEGR